MSGTQKAHARVGSLSQIGTIAKYNFLNYFRARRFYVMLAIILIIGGLVTGLVAYYGVADFGGSSALGFYGAGWGSFASFVIILSAVFFGGDAISGEFQNRTGYFLVPNPIRKSAVYIGKYLAAIAASSLTLGVFALIMIANGLYYFPGSFPWEFAQSITFAWAYLIAVMSLSFAFSSLFKSTSISILMTVILLLFVFNIVDTVVSIVAGVEPWYSIVYGAGIIGDILRVPYPTHIPPRGPGGRFAGALFAPTVPEGLAILLVYFVVMGIVGLLLFEKKEFTS
ncbi:MAG: ABC transporter permease [Nitrososphaerota archaeon]|nr:ABC transporter permease [Nitrososphaerota archaeon]MDG7023528.1 ABC transporter permease [Nitrososphaerota archaeon]